MFERNWLHCTASYWSIKSRSLNCKVNILYYFVQFYWLLLSYGLEQEEKDYANGKSKYLPFREPVIKLQMMEDRFLVSKRENMVSISRRISMRFGKFSMRCFLCGIKWWIFREYYDKINWWYYSECSIVYRGFDVSYNCNDPVSHSEYIILTIMRNSVLLILLFVQKNKGMLIDGKNVRFCAATRWISKIILLAAISWNIVLSPLQAAFTHKPHRATIHT